jgi:CBS domain-containing protein
MHVKAILAGKGGQVINARPGETIAAVAARLATNKIGALVVLDEADLLVGILSERDIVRALAKHGEGTITMTAGELMTRPVQSCQPEDTIDHVMHVMTHRRFRHMPVLEDGQLIGIISIGDVVKHRLELSEMEVDSLRQYVLEAH